MNRFRSFLVAASAVLFALVAGAALAGSPVNTYEGVAVKGFDPVAYFTDNKAIKGSRDITATHEGATYYFATTAHRDAFVANPTKYAPQFGGFCAFGVAKGAKVEIEPAQFSIVDGKLYLNKSRSVRESWSADIPGHIAAAEKNWPELAKK